MHNYKNEDEYKLDIDEGIEIPEVVMESDYEALGDINPQIFEALHGEEFKNDKDMMKFANEQKVGLLSVIDSQKQVKKKKKDYFKLDPQLLQPSKNLHKSSEDLYQGKNAKKNDEKISSLVSKEEEKQVYKGKDKKDGNEQGVTQTQPNQFSQGTTPKKGMTKSHSTHSLTNLNSSKLKLSSAVDEEEKNDEKQEKPRLRRGSVSKLNLGSGFKAAEFRERTGSRHSSRVIMTGEKVFDAGKHIGGGEIKQLQRSLSSQKLQEQLGTKSQLEKQKENLERKGLLSR